MCRTACPLRKRRVAVQGRGLRDRKDEDRYRIAGRNCYVKGPSGSIASMTASVETCFRDIKRPQPDAPKSRENRTNRPTENLEAITPAPEDLVEAKSRRRSRATTSEGMKCAAALRYVKLIGPSLPARNRSPAERQSFRSSSGPEYCRDRSRLKLHYYMHPRSSKPSAPKSPETPDTITENPLLGEMSIPSGKQRRRVLNHPRLPFPRHCSRRPEHACPPRRLFHKAPRVNPRRYNR
jgi:hypothetical protein